MTSATDTPISDAIFNRAGFYVGDGDQYVEHGRLKADVRQLERELSAALAERDATYERAAQVCEKRAELRFEEHGYTEPDTNASYYQGAYNELGDSLDEEDADCAAAIRALQAPTNAAGDGFAIDNEHIAASPHDHLPAAPTTSLPEEPEELSEAIKWQVAHKDELNVIVSYIDKLRQSAEALSRQSPKLPEERIAQIVSDNTPVVDNRYRCRLATPADVERAIQQALEEAGKQA